MRFRSPWIAALLMGLSACRQSPQASDVPSDVRDIDVLLAHDLEADAGTAVDALDARQDLISGSEDVPSDHGRPPFDVLPPTDLGGAHADAADVPGDSRIDVPEGWIVCAEVGTAPRAVNPRSNPSHCGACNHPCCGLFCINGMCAADGPPGTASCPLSPDEERRRGCFGPVPIRIEVDSYNCGSCGERCGEHQECVRAQCVNQ